MIPARKRWGQHFLVRSETAVRIAETARIEPGETVIEVGPGDGALTRPLADRAGRLLAIEIDPLRADALERELAGRREVRIRRGDVLERPFTGWLADEGWSPPAVLVSNLPYNAATPILLSAIEEKGAISRVIATVQKEVARRFAAGPGDDEYGYLSVRVASSARARILFDLPPGAFRPRPKVTSTVLELVPCVGGLPAAARARALELASTAFRFRRKTLPNALSSAADRRRIERELAALGRDPRVRAEELSLDEYVALAERLDVP